MEVNRLVPLPPENAGAPGVRNGNRRPPEGSTFKEVLAGLTGAGGLQFSRHARERMLERNIHLGREELDRISRGVEKAAAKGARDSLLLLDELALVVSVRNRTVVTAVDGQHLKENVFTNIDSAVIV